MATRSAAESHAQKAAKVRAEFEKKVLPGDDGTPVPGSSRQNFPYEPYGPSGSFQEDPPEAS